MVTRLRALLAVSRLGGMSGPPHWAGSSTGSSAAALSPPKLTGDAVSKGRGTDRGRLEAWDPRRQLTHCIAAEKELKVNHPTDVPKQNLSPKELPCFFKNFRRKKITKAL